MARLSEKQRIEVLIMIGCGVKQRSQHEVCEMFNNKYPNQQISQSTISRIFHKFEESGTVSDLPRTGRRRTVSENDKQNVMVAGTESPNDSVRSIGTNHGLAKSSVHRTLRNEKWYPYKVNVVQELVADDTDRRVEFCEIMTTLLHRQPAMKNLILFSDEAYIVLTRYCKQAKYTILEFGKSILDARGTHVTTAEGECLGWYDWKSNTGAFLF